MTDLQPSSLLPTLTSSLLTTAADLPARLAEAIRRRVPAYRSPSPVADQDRTLSDPRDAAELYLAVVAPVGHARPAIYARRNGR
jgi:hypothetical protein